METSKQMLVWVIALVASFFLCFSLAKLNDDKQDNNKTEITTIIEETQQETVPNHDFSSCVIELEDNSTVGFAPIIEPTTEEETTTVDMVAEYKQKIDSIQCEDTWEWYKQYKLISDEYSSYISRETIYDRFTEEEVELLFRIVEAEVTGNKNFINKANVASVIFNRLKNDGYPNDLISILTQEYQFSTYASGRYMSVEVTDATRLACEFAYEIGDTVSGALFFDSKRERSWAYGKLILVTVDEVGHSFYK